MRNVEISLSMKRGEGEDSYAKNSLVQREALIKARPILEESVREMMNDLSDFPNCLRIVDLGCSSGPNALLVTWDIINVVHLTCQELNRKEPTFQVFLNDLPTNDFNTLFMTIPRFYEKLESQKGSDFGPCFIAAMPGNFYGRLFPDCFLHFAHSSHSLHWHCNVPDGLVSESGDLINKGNIYIAKTSPNSVFESYKELFVKDFGLFIRSRSQEICHGGHMVLTIMGRDDNKYHSYTLLELLGITLNDMVQEGLVEEERLDSFNMPCYEPTEEEVRHMIETEGSFEIQRLEAVKVDWYANMDEANKHHHYPTRGNYVAVTIRAVTQPILVTHFGEEITDDLFQRYAVKMDEFLEVEKGQYTNILVSMKKK